MIIGWLKRRKEREQEENDLEREDRNRLQKEFDDERQELLDFAKPGDRIMCAGITFVVKSISSPAHGWLCKRYGILPRIHTVYAKDGELRDREFYSSDLDMLKAENKR